MKTIQYSVAFATVVASILFWGVSTGRFDPKLLRPAAVQSIIEHFADGLITIPIDAPAGYEFPEPEIENDNIPDLPSPEIEGLRIREIETYPTIKFKEEKPEVKPLKDDETKSGYNEGDRDIA